MHGVGVTYGLGALGVGALGVGAFGVGALGVGALGVGALGVGALGVEPLIFTSKHDQYVVPTVSFHSQRKEYVPLCASGIVND